MKKYYGEEFINKIYKSLFESDIVKRSGKGANKNEDVSLYFDRLERISRKTIEHDKYDKIKRYYYKKYVISANDIPDSYFKNQEQIALNRGYGHVHYDEKTKSKEKEIIVKEQEESLDSWLDYFASSDTEHYPTWFKYFCFQGMIRIGYFDKEKNQYTKRTKNTIKPFIEINREAIAMVYDLLMKYLKKESLGDKSLEQLINSGSFSKMYAYCIRKLDSIKKNSFNSDDGIWKKYNQGSNPNILFNDIHGKGTGWCTAGGIETAKKHIDGGDFYVYYTKDEKGEYTNPRIAIRLEANSIAEIRGIAENQNLELNMEKVVEEKLKEFSDAEAYKKKVKDMEMLTYIYTKWQQKLELTKEDLHFLYEIDSKIIGFGYKKDPRIKEIIETRDKKIDFSKIFDCNPNQISLTEEEALKGNIIYHYGELNLDYLTSAEGLTLPQSVGGNLFLSSLTSAEGLTLPQSVGDDLDLESLTNAEGLTLPQSVGGTLYLSCLTSAEGLTLPQSVGGNLDLRSLTSAEGLTLPQSVGGNLTLIRLTSAEGLILPQSIEGFLDLGSLTSAEGLILPQSVGGSLVLESLTSAEGLTLPQSVGRHLYLSSLTSAEGLTLPQSVGGTLWLRSLTSAEGLIIPDTLNCDLFCPIANNDINILKEMCKKNNKKK